MLRRPSILAAAVGTVLSLAAIEVVFRVADLGPPPPESADTSADTESAEKGGADWQLRRYWKELNSHRYHDDEWTLRKPAGTWRTVVLGDSFTEGKRVAREELFTERIEASLNERAGPGRHYELLNVAHAGWGTTNELEALEALLAAQVVPDSVLLVYFVNDATALESNPILVEALEERERRGTSVLARWSRAWAWFEWRLGARELTELTLADYRAAFDESPRAGAQWKRSKDALRALRDLARQYGFPFGVVLFPVLAQLDDSHELTDVYEQVEACCRSLGVPYRSLLPAFLGHRAQDLWVSPRNAHANAEGHAIAARAIEDFLIEEDLVPLSLAVPAGTAEH